MHDEKDMDDEKYGRSAWWKQTYGHLQV